MRLDGIITFEIKIDGTWTDYTDGFISSNIVRGIQAAYQGPFQQSESGVLTIVSRNINLDPYVNSDIRMNREVRIKASGYVIFTGRINSVNVDYQPKGKPQITTLTAVDMVGTMALHTLRDTFKSRFGSSMNTVQFVQGLNETNSAGPNSEIIGFVGTREGTSYCTTDARAVPSATTALKMATGLSAGDLRFFYADRENTVKFVPSLDFRKDDSPKLQFDSDGGATNYRAVDLTDGFDLLKNKISFQTYGSLIPLYTNSYSESQWGPQVANVETYWYNTTTQDAQTDAAAALIFQQTAHPTREISRITFDAEAAIDNVAAIDILDNVTVHHAVDGLEIQRDYAIIGISHKIRNTDWETTYHLRNLDTYNTVFPTPIVGVSPSSGTISNTFTFSITNLNSIAHDQATYSWKDNNVQFSTAESPTKTYSIGDVGTHSITCTVTDSYGFVKTSAAYSLQVFGAAPTGVSFTHTANPADTAVINFVATATNATSYSWDFGDSTTGTGQSLSHRYATSGSKTVILSAINAYGTTTSTQTFSVTVPPAPTNDVGTWGVRYLKIGIDQFNASGYYWPLMKNFRATTSATLDNRAATNIIEFALPYQVSGQPFGNHEWRRYNGTASDVPNIGSCTSTLLRNGGTDGIKPFNTISGTANWSLIINLQNTYYDIKNIAIGKSAYSSQPINVYATTYNGDGIANGTVSPNSVTWTKIGTIDSYLETMDPIVTMPLNLP